MRILILNMLSFCMYFNVLPLASMQQPLSRNDIDRLNRRLVTAVKIDNIDWIKRLIVQGAEVNHILTTLSYNGNISLLSYAIINFTKSETIKELLALGARSNSGPAEVVSPLRVLLDRYLLAVGYLLPQKQFLIALAYLFEHGAVIDQASQKLIDKNPRVKELVVLAQQMVKRRI